MEEDFDSVSRQYSPQPPPRGAAQSRPLATPQVVTQTTAPRMNHFSALAPATLTAMIVSPCVTQSMSPTPPPRMARFTTPPRVMPVSAGVTQILSPPLPPGIAHLLSPALAPAPGVTQTLTLGRMDSISLIAGLTCTHVSPERGEPGHVSSQNP